MKAKKRTLILEQELNKRNIELPLREGTVKISTTDRLLAATSLQKMGVDIESLRDKIAKMNELADNMLKEKKALLDELKEAFD